VAASALGAAWAGKSYVRNAADRVLVNATPAGARGEPVLALGTDFTGLTVLDAPYAEHSASTGLATAVRASAGRLVDGLTLLLAQAVGQAEAFSGTRPDPDVLALALRPRTNLVLAGLRGAGKTTVGRLVARRLGRPFVDLDEEVARVSGRTPDEVIRKSGLAAFRREERWAVARLAGRRGLVVATGGGVVEDPRNVPRLRALGPCVWLDVPAGVAGARVQADPTPRPPLAADPDPTAESHALLLRRSRRYGLLAHARVDATRAPEVVAREVAALWLAHERTVRSPSGC
jgi:shikimate kinase